MAEAPRDGTQAALEGFLGWAGRTGELNASTAQAFRAAVRQVLAVEEDVESLDVTTIDPDAVLDRWENLNRTRYSAGSLATYRSRFRQSLAMYAAWLNKDQNWKSAGKAQPKQGTKAATTTGRPRKLSTTISPCASATGAVEAVGTNANSSSSVRLVAYDLPLRPDLLVRLNLPVDLTPADAARLSTFVRSLAFATAGPAETAVTETVTDTDDGGGRDG